MARLTQLPEQAIIDGFKGTIDYYVHEGIPCARKWPTSPGHRRAPDVEAQWPIFTKASQLYSQLSPEVVEAYRQLAESTRLSSRDWFMRGYISGIFHKEPPP